MPSQTPLRSPAPLQSMPVPDSLPNYDVLYHAFVNLTMVEADYKQKTSNDMEGSNDKESVLEKKLRLSSTAPVSLALQDASRALADFETDDAIGKALKGGLSQELGDMLANLSYLEIQQLQRKLAKKQTLRRSGLYAQYLRCPTDEILEQYMPRTSQTPKPSRIKIELRNAIAQKFAAATREAHLEVFSKYSTNGELKHIMERLDEITSQGLADGQIIAKKLKCSQEVLEAGSKGSEGQLSKLPRRDADDAVLQGAAQKIETARQKVIARRAEKQKNAKEKKSKQRLRDLQKFQKVSSTEGQGPNSPIKQNGTQKGNSSGRQLPNGTH